MQLSSVLNRALGDGFKTQSNFARNNAEAVAAAASCGLITVLERGGGFGATWRITLEGRIVLDKQIDNVFEGEAPAFMRAAA